MDMEIIGGLFLIWLIHAGIALVLSAPIVFVGRHRVRWRSWELSAVVVPYVGWLILMLSDSTGKTLSNLGEPSMFAFAVPVAALARVVIGRQMDERLCAGGLIVTLTAIAAAVYWFVPALPE